MNSAPTSSISPAALKKARISHSTLWTGLRAKITAIDEAIVRGANRENARRAITRATRHSREGGNLAQQENWVPACAGMTKKRSPKRPVSRGCSRLPIRRIGGKVRGNRLLPLVAVREQFRLIVEQLLARFGREFEIRPFDDRIH